MSTLGDLDGDGLSELSLSSRSPVGQEHQVSHDLYSERDWESTSFTYNDELEFLELSTSSNGEASMLLSFSNDESLHFVEHVDDGTATGVWADKTVASILQTLQHTPIEAPVGRPFILSTEGGHGLKVQTTSSFTAVEQSIISSGTMGKFLGSALDSDGHQHLAHAIPPEVRDTRFLHLLRTITVGEFQVTTNVNLDYAISVLTDSNDATTLLYRDSTDNQLSLAHYDGAGPSPR